MSFEPTEPQNGVDTNPFALIDPETIPYPLTDVWSLNYAAETLRTGGEEIAAESEDMRSTWQGLQAHYEAPESETLFSKMDPVVERGEDVESDLVAVAGALEDLAEAAGTARGKLNTLRIDAQAFRNRHHDKKVWWLTKDDETDEWAIKENIRLKSEINTAWATFNEAENNCATRISALFGGPSYASPDQAGGDGVLVYGLPTDAGEINTDLSMEGFNKFTNQFADWAGSEFHPELAKFDNPYGQAVWDTVVTDALWGSAVGLTSKLGYWHPDNGWRADPSGRWDNAKAAWEDAKIDAGTLIGVHDEHGWLEEPGEDGEQGWGAGWDRWVGNVEASAKEVFEGHTAWSTREDGVAYSNTTIATNAAMMTVGLPLKLVKIVFGAGVDVPSGGSSPDTDGSGPQGSRGTGSANSDDFHARGGPGTKDWPSSPLRQDGQGGASTTERFADQLAMTQDSLLDPNQYRPTPSPAPDRPETGGGPAPQNPTTPHPGENGLPQEDRGSTDRPRNGDSPRRPGEDDPSAPLTRPEDKDANASRNPGRESGTSTPSPRSGNESGAEDSSAPRSEESSQGHRDDGSDRQGDVPSQHHDNEARERTGPREETERPTPATGGGSEGGGRGGDPPIPPRDSGDSGDDPPSGSVPNRPGSDEGDLFGPSEPPTPRESSGSGGPTSSDKPSADHPVEVKSGDSRFFPEKGDRFGDGVTLDPDTRYTVMEADGKRSIDYITDGDGKIREIRADSKAWGGRNPEFMDPRPDMTYVADGNYTFRTDEHGRTVEAEGSIHRSENHRNETQQKQSGHDGELYFELLNERQRKDFFETEGRWPEPDEVPQYQKVEFQGGHLFGTQFFGPGELLNMPPMRFDVNQNRTGTAFPDRIPEELGTIDGSFYNLERSWRGLLKHGDKWRHFKNPSFNNGEWNDALDLKPGKPDIQAKITSEFDPKMPRIEHPPKSRKFIDPPPSAFHVEWSINGVPMEPQRYKNLPPLA